MCKVKFNGNCSLLVLSNQVRQKFNFNFALRHSINRTLLLGKRDFNSLIGLRISSKLIFDIAVLFVNEFKFLCIFLSYKQICTKGLEWWFSFNIEIISQTNKFKFIVTNTGSGTIGSKVPRLIASFVFLQLRRRITNALNGDIIYKERGVFVNWNWLFCEEWYFKCNRFIWLKVSLIWFNFKTEVFRVFNIERFISFISLKKIPMILDFNRSDIIYCKCSRNVLIGIGIFKADRLHSTFLCILFNYNIIKLMNA